MDRLVEPLDDLKRIRLDKKLSQETLGAKIGKHKAWVSEVERSLRRPTEDELITYGLALKYPFRYKDETCHEVVDDDS